MDDHYPGHLFLAQAQNREEAIVQVHHFFTTTTLLRYDQVDIKTATVLAATSPEFWPTTTEAIDKNKNFSQQLASELQATGIKAITDLPSLPQGYPSKLLHILTHMVDGFIGIDSAFYNLIESSHAISPPLTAKIKAHPANYWLIPVCPGPVASAILPPLSPHP